MATIQSSGFLHSSFYSKTPKQCKKSMIMAILDIPKSRAKNMPLPILQTRSMVEELELSRGFLTSFTTTPLLEKQVSSSEKNESDSLVIAKLYAILEAIADRIEMHKNIGEQRKNWNSLLLTSINAITLAAATMSGIAATSAVFGAPAAALNISSTLMFLAATGMLLIMNKIQPSQLVEEQRNATRLFQQLQNQIERIISIGNPTDRDVNESMQKVLALDRAYPLPLLGVMLEKFPSNVEPTVWWPQQRPRQAMITSDNSNGWNAKLEKEMRSLVEVLRVKDEAEYLRLGGKFLKLNKLLAISGPLLTGLAAIGSAFVGCPSQGPWAAMLGVVAGSMASVVNTLEHGGQVGMVFEMYRSNAGFFKLMEESIESNLVERRENGELFEMKLALQLGRSLSNLRDLASSSSTGKVEDINEFGSKLF